MSEEKLNRLSGEVYLQLRDQGVIAAAYAHLLSLLLWPRVIQRTLQRVEAQPQHIM